MSGTPSGEFVQTSGVPTGATWEIHNRKTGDNEFYSNRACFDQRPELRTLLFGNGITIIGPNVFTRTPIQRVIFPETLTVIAQSAFQDCTNLTQINAETSATATVPNTFPSSLVQVQSQAFYNCVGLTELAMLAVSSMGQSAFQGCVNLRNVTLSSQLPSITWYGFADTAMPEISLPLSVSAIYAGGFQRCGLESLVLPNGLTFIMYSAFQGCTRLTSVVFPRAITAIG